MEVSASLEMGFFKSLVVLASWCLRDYFLLDDFSSGFISVNNKELVVLLLLSSSV